jgi:hypothetical protein
MVSSSSSGGAFVDLTELFNSDFMRFQTTDGGSGDRETLVTRPNPAQAQMGPAKAGNEDSIHPLALPSAVTRLKGQLSSRCARSSRATSDYQFAISEMSRSVAFLRVYLNWRRRLTIQSKCRQSSLG